MPYSPDEIFDIYQQITVGGVAKAIGLPPAQEDLV
jgi:hypothetical protein